MVQDTASQVRKRISKAEERIKIKAKNKESQKKLDNLVGNGFALAGIGLIIYILITFY